MHCRHSWHFLAVAFTLLCAGAPALAAPQRIVSTNLCTDEYVFRLVPKDHIAALSVLAGEARPVVSTIAGKVAGIDLIHPSAETVLARDPDLVVMYAGTNPRLRAHLRAAGVRVLEVPWADSLAQVRKVTLMLGRRLGAVARARVLVAQMDARLAAARKSAPRPSVPALIYEPNGYVTADHVSDQIMSAAGLRNLAPAVGPNRLGRLSVEAVIAAAPRLLILNAAPESGPSLADAALDHPALAALKGHTLIAHADLTPLLCPGPWSVDVASAFAGLARKAGRLARTGPQD